MTDPNVPASKSAFETQKGGDHYKAMGMQPVEFAMRNGWDCCAFSTLKYLSRHGRKEGKLDVEKALHFIELREELFRGARMVLQPAGFSEIQMAEYVSKNAITGLDAEALALLEEWVKDDRKSALTVLKQTMIAIVDSYR